MPKGGASTQCCSQHSQIFHLHIPTFWLLLIVLWTSQSGQFLGSTFDVRISCTVV